MASLGLLVARRGDDQSAFRLLNSPGALNSAADAEGYREGELGHRSGETNGSPDLAIQVEMDEGGSRLDENEGADEGAVSDGLEASPEDSVADGRSPDGGILDGGDSDGSASDPSGPSAGGASDDVGASSGSVEVVMGGSSSSASSMPSLIGGMRNFLIRRRFGDKQPGALGSQWQDATHQCDWGVQLDVCEHRSHRQRNKSSRGCCDHG